MKLITAPNLRDPDGVYAQVIALNERCEANEWPRISARLLLILLNHIGDEEVIQEALDLAALRSAR